MRDKRSISIALVFLLLISIPLSLSFWGITERAKFEESWEYERFLVNGKYLIVKDADIYSYQNRKILIVDLHVREPLTRQDLNEFKQKVQRNFSEDLLIRTRITYIP